MATSDPSCSEEAFEPASQLRPAAPAAAMLAARPSAAAPVAPEEDDLTKAKRIVCEANDATAFIALSKLELPKPKKESVPSPARTSVRRRR